MNKSKKNIALAIIAIALLLCSVYSFNNAYQIWNKYEWAIRRLGNPILYIAYPTLYPKLLQAIREYVMLFPLYFLVGLITATSALIMIAINSRRKFFLIATVLMISSALIFFEAYKIWEIHRWATLQTTTPPESYYSEVFAEANNAFKTLFPLYLVIGSTATTSGLILTIINLKKKLKFWTQ